MDIYTTNSSSSVIPNGIFMEIVATDNLIYDNLVLSKLDICLKLSIICATGTEIWTSFEVLSLFFFTNAQGYGYSRK